MIQGGGNSGAEMQPPGLGMPMQPGSQKQVKRMVLKRLRQPDAGAPGQAGVGILGNDSWELSWCRDLCCWSVNAADDWGV